MGLNRGFLAFIWQLLLENSGLVGSNPRLNSLSSIVSSHHPEIGSSRSEYRNSGPSDVCLCLSFAKHALCLEFHIKDGRLT